jgi:oligosaccharide repeat unit polymerase
MTECATNPLFLFLAVWGSAAALYLGGVRANLFPPGATEALWAVLLNVTTFSLGYLTWSLLVCPKTLCPEMPSSPGVPLTAQRLRTSLHLTLAFGLLAVGFCVVRLAIFSRMLQIDLLYLISHPILCKQMLMVHITPTMYGIRLCTIAIVLASSVFSAGFVLLGILLYFGHSWRRYGLVLLFLLTSLVIGLLSFGRQEVTINILFVALSYLFMHRLYHIRRPRDVVLPLLVPLVALALLFVSIDLLLHKSQTYQREGRLEGFLFSLYWYIASPLAAFAEYLRNTEHTLTLGQSLFFPVYKWLARLHLVPEATKTVLTEWLFIPFPANVYSYLRDIHEDFGFAGLAIVPYVLGSVSAVLRRRAEAFFPCLNLYIALLIFLIFSIYNYLLISSQLYVQALFALLFLRFRLTGLDRFQAEGETPSQRS